MNLEASSLTAAGAVTLRLIGDFDLDCGGSPVPVRRYGQRLMAVLGLSPRPVLRSRIAGLLWAESTAAQASGNLRATLSRLPRPGGRPLVSSDGARLGLADHVDVDLHRAVEHMRTLRHGESDDPAGWDDAGTLLDDDLLPLWDDDWVMLERERHRQSRLHALETHSRWLRGAGRFEEALEAALAALAGEPLRESAHRLVIEVHLAEGNAAEALRQYDAYRVLLREELGLSPSTALRDVVRPLLGRPDDAL